MSSSADSENSSVSGNVSDNRSVATYDLINNLVISGFAVTAVMCVIGIVNNLLSIAVFCTLGFRETINISFLGLAVADIGCLFTHFEMNVICSLLYIAEFDFVVLDLVEVAGSWPRLCFLRTSGLITAFIALERCFCIVSPVKIKAVLTWPRTAAIIISMFVTVFASMCPVYSDTSLSWKFYPDKNRTMLGEDYTRNRGQVYRVCHILSNFYGYLAFISAFTFTTVLVRELKKRTSWRLKSAVINRDKSFSILERDLKVVKMAVGVSAMFIITFFPSTVLFTAALIEPDFGVRGQYEQEYLMASTVCYSLEIFNLSSNLFICRHMSSRFRTTLNGLVVGRTGKI